MDAIRAIWSGEREAHVIVADEHPSACFGVLSERSIEGVEEVVLGSRTVQIRVGCDADPDAALDRVLGVLREGDWARTRIAGRVVEIPICSDPDLAPDLEFIARAAGLSVEGAADLHASCGYTVRFVGFSPGFPYLDGLPAALHAARHDAPRARVRGGSVGIAGARCGMYPHATPGGWRVIGATPACLFDPDRERPALLSPRDTVRFRRIDRETFDALERGRG